MIIFENNLRPPGLRSAKFVNTCTISTTLGPSGTQFRYAKTNSSFGVADYDSGQRSNMLTGVISRWRETSFSLARNAGLWRDAVCQVAPALSLWGVRWASKKAGSSRRNHGGKSSGKRLGIKKQQGSQVHAGDILVRQKMAFRWYPGSFVTTGRDRTLSAQVSGTVYFSQQRWTPKPDTAFGQDIAPTLTDEEMTRTFVNVRPEPEVGSFRLKEQV